MSDKNICDGKLDCPYGQDERNCMRYVICIIGLLNEIQTKNILLSTTKIRKLSSSHQFRFKSECTEVTPLGFF